jgi:alkanesulfonate monooxygenase SsuD/methylene tetrahydromethanopterin reductase-like flavin-dependent oxidoreductase (luciferase family)
LQSPCPVWLTTNAGRLADGWMTHSVGRDTMRPGNVLCHHVNINEDAEAALADARRHLDLYYGADYAKQPLEARLAYGSPQDCVAQLRRFLGCGCNRITLRLVTMGDAMSQFRRLTEEVLPFVV